MAGTDVDFDAAEFRTDLPWLAGLYEGEGSIHCLVRSETAASLRLTIQMTDEDVLQTARRRAGVGTIYGPYERNPPDKPIIQWTVYRSEEAYFLAMAMWPYLHERRRGQIAVSVASWLEAHHARPTVEDRFWAKVVKSEDPHGCWVWTGALNGSRRYGQFDRGEQGVAHAHRCAWEFVNGPIKIAYDNLRPRCTTPLCVRPDHFRLTSQECAKGHLLTADNTLPRGDGGRKGVRCKACKHAVDQAGSSNGRS